MNDIFKLILSLSISGSLIILVLFLCKPFIKNRINKCWQYYIWLVVIARLLLPFGPEASPAQKLIEKGDQMIRQIVDIPISGQITDPAIQSGNDTTIKENNNLLKTNEETSIGLTAQKMKNALLENLWFVWIILALILLIRKITIYQGFVRYIKTGSTEVSNIILLDKLAIIGTKIRMNKPVELYTNSLISSPLLLGFIRPCIVLPTADLPDSDFQYTILHELEHYKRRDILYK